MDDQNDRKNSRAPKLEDLVDLCRYLNERGAKYAVIGGFAVILHGAARTTKDIDLLVDPSTENIKKIKEAMGHLPDNAAHEIEDDDVQRYTVVRIGDEYVVDLLASACGVTFDEAKRSLQWVELDGVRIPVVGKQTLIRTKNTIRPSDKMDINYLLRIIEEENREKSKK
ncbi:MAG: nucleotidyltransferase [Deltaproteobacteria bacterium]|nr:nucleotidyltransferase [Deltaproteobacteria bacterium]MBI2500252.1 nucleotidyltransferase [Deltaproteobacteria bacterium]MBI4196667.1 nucleotidyltransferase [Deltaproteobacteria bacterium]